MNPELSFNEENTSIFIRELLDKWNVTYNYPYVNHGLLACIDGAKSDGPVIALRSDMDALPILEQTGLDYTSKNDGVMHACGHDIHMASLLGTIRILSEMKEHIKGKVLFILEKGSTQID
jgi:amidohydrolase